MTFCRTVHSNHPLNTLWASCSFKCLKSVFAFLHHLHDTEKAASNPAKSIPPLKRHGVLCTACNKVMLKGHTAFQRSGSSKLYCSPQCLCGSKKKTCHCCLKYVYDISFGYSCMLLEWFELMYVLSFQRDL